MLEDLQTTLDLMYRVFYMMIFMIQRVCVKACYEYYVFVLILMLTIDMVSSSSMAVARDHVHHHRYFAYLWSKSVLYEPLTGRLVDFYREQKK